VQHNLDALSKNHEHLCTRIHIATALV